MEIHKAIEIDPYSPILRNAEAGVYYICRQYALSIQAFKKTLELDKNNSLAHIFLTLPCTEKGLYEEAIAWGKKGIDLTGGNYPLAISFLGYA